MTQGSKDAIRAVIAAWSRLDEDEKEVCRVFLIEAQPEQRRGPGRPKGSRNHQDLNTSGEFRDNVGTHIGKA